MDERNKLIEQLIKEEGGTRPQYLHLMKEVTRHETGGTFNPKLEQAGRRGKGPGVGNYQFERGKNAGAITAARRTKNYYNDNNIPVKKWLEKASAGNDLDVSTLTPEQQDILFLGNMKVHPKADLSKIWKGEQSIPEFWANYHWAGAKKDRATRINNFKGTFEEYKNDYVPSEFKKEQPSIAQDNTRVVIPEQQTPQNYNAPHQVINQLPDAPKPIVEGGNMQNLITYIQGQKDKYSTNQKAEGGPINPDNSNLYRRDFTSFGTGGLHSQNPNGGIPLGVGSNNRRNTVEQGESSYNFKEGKFIFSNRIKI